MTAPPRRGRPMYGRLVRRFYRPQWPNSTGLDNIMTRLNRASTWTVIWPLTALLLPCCMAAGCSPVDARQNRHVLESRCSRVLIIIIINHRSSQLNSQSRLACATIRVVLLTNIANRQRFITKRAYIHTHIHAHIPSICVYKRR